MRLTSMTLPASFAAQEVVAAAGKVWVPGQHGGEFRHRLRPGRGYAGDHDVDPRSPAACASYVTTGDGRIYLVATQGLAAANVRAYHVEVFDPATHVAQVLSPVVLSNVGSAIAHMGFTYGDGALWLYGYRYPAADADGRAHLAHQRGRRVHDRLRARDRRDLSRHCSRRGGHLARRRPGWAARRRMGAARGCDRHDGVCRSGRPPELGDVAGRRG